MEGGAPACMEMATHLGHADAYSDCTYRTSATPNEDSTHALSPAAEEVTGQPRHSINPVSTAIYTRPVLSLQLDTQIT